MTPRLEDYRRLLLAFHDTIRRPGWHLQYQRDADAMAALYDRMTAAERQTAEQMQKDEWRQRLD